MAVSFLLSTIIESGADGTTRNRVRKKSSISHIAAVIIIYLPPSNVIFDTEGEYGPSPTLVAAATVTLNDAN